jgi:flagella basal body P-ring formation protein FlgA
MAQRYKNREAQRFETGVHVRFPVVAFCCLLFFAVAGVAAADMTALADNGKLQVVVQTDAQVSGERILLGQISKITGGDERLQQLVAGVDLGPSPRPGQERRITESSISVALANAGLTGNKISATIPEIVLIRGAFQRISEASLEEAFKRYVTNAVGGDEVAFSRIDVRGVKPLPLGRIELAPEDNGKERIKGKTSLRMSVAVNGEDFGQVTVSGWVDRYSQVVCAARTVSRKTILSEDDLCFKRINIARAPDRIVFNMQEALGKRVRSTLQAGKCLQQHKLMVVPLVERGDRVKLLVNSGAVNISTMGIAKADGGAGDQIQVENLSSKKTVIGRVVDNVTVEVLF